MVSSRSVSLMLLALAQPMVAAAQSEGITLCDPKTHPDHAATTAANTRLKLLGSKKYTELETKLASHRAAGREKGTYLAALRMAVDGLAEARETPQLKPQLDGWCEASPKSYLPYLVRGTFCIQWAWQARGSGYASTVTQKGWKLFRERLRQAKRDLERAHALDPTCPIASASLITVAKGLSLPEAQARAYFAQAIKANPRCVAAYRNLLTYLMPKWHGSATKMWSFARSSVARNPKEPGLLRLIVDAHFEEHRARGNAYLQSGRVTQQLTTTLEKLAKAYPRQRGPLLLHIRLVLLTTRAPQLLAELSRKAANLGDPRAQAVVANELINGPPAKRNLKLGFQWLCRAAHGGDTPAQVALAMFFSKGQYLAQNQRKASAWYLRAAEAGRVDIMKFVAIRYARGAGFEKDLKKAREWFRRAAEGREVSCMYEYGRLCYLGLGGPKDRRTAVSWWKKSAAKGYAASNYVLGQTCFKSNPALSARYLRVAYRKRYRKAKALLQRLLQANPNLRQAGDP